jgi:hypothetical protein
MSLMVISGRLGQQISNYMSMYIGQPTIDTIAQEGKLGVVDAH